jgi:hypothetical protein
VIVEPGEKLLDPMGDVTQELAFAHGNNMLKNAFGAISDVIHMRPGARYASRVAPLPRRSGGLSGAAGLISGRPPPLH